MSSTSATACTNGRHGELRPTLLRVMLTYAGSTQSVNDDDALVCDAGGDELIGERTATFLLTARALAPDADMRVTVCRTRERM